MKQPTKAQIKVFWEWRGFILKELHPLAPKDSSCTHCGRSEQVLPSEEPYFVLYKPDGGQYNLWIGRKWDTEIPIGELYPTIDLNNLFKWSPDYQQVIFQPGYCGITIENKLYEGSGDTEEDALFWALDKVREADNA